MKCTNFVKLLQFLQFAYLSKLFRPRTNFFAEVNLSWRVFVQLIYLFSSIVIQLVSSFYFCWREMRRKYLKNLKVFLELSWIVLLRNYISSMKHF